MKIGAQLYTVRSACQDLDSFAETLKRVADMGYTSVQVSGTCAYDPYWLKEQLDKNGLVCPITHPDSKRIESETELLCKEHKIFGCRNIGLGIYAGLRQEDYVGAYEDFKRIFKPVAKTMKENDCYFMYHNHDDEFKKINGKTILRHLAEDFAPDELGFTLDIFWVQAGGANPAEILRELSGRVPCIHLKDFAHGTKYAVIGDGNINMDAVAAAAADAGTEYMLVEQDNCYGADPFECLQRSYQYLKAMGLE